MSALGRAFSGLPLGALSVWEELLEVIVVGAIAGIGVGAAFAFLVRGAARQSSIRRGEDEGSVVGNVVLAAVAGLVCVGAVVFAIYEMLTG